MSNSIGPGCFGYDRKSYEVARAAVSKLKQEKDVFEYLNESKPAFLRPGDALLLGIDKQRVEKEVKGISDKLKIHGYPDRGNRLIYLHSVLSSKLTEKDDMFKAVIKLLLEMSERPTSLLHLDLGEDVYSLQPDEDMSEEEDSVKQKELLKQILMEGGNEDGITISYSSDSDLSEWSSDEEESEKSKNSTNDIVQPDRNLKPSRSFSEFSDLPLAKDLEDKKQEMELYWSMEAVRAQKFLNTDLRKVNIRPLQSQPVISGLLALQSKFGEHWEWKKLQNSNEKKTRLIILEEDVIREILLQFAAVNPETSPVFTSDWKVKPELMVSSLSRSSFLSMMKTYEHVFSSLTKLKTFVNSIEVTAISNSYQNHPPILFRSYAQGLSKITTYICEEIGKIEKNLKKNNEHCIQGPQPCTTLVQLGRQIQGFVDIIILMDRIHSGAIGSYHEVDQWFYSIRLISSLAMHLNLQTKSIKFAAVFYLFSKCLHAFLDEMNLAMNTLNWREEQFIFMRSKEIKLSDSNFWTDSLTQRPYEERLKEIGVPVVSSIAYLTPGILIVLKTSEILNQLEEDYIKALGSPPSSRNVIDDFINRMLPQTLIEEDATLNHDLAPDYKTHFKFIGLEGTLVADSVKYILERMETKANTRAKNKDFSLERFLSISEVPDVNTWDILSRTLQQWYGPHFERAKNCMYKIFLDYQVDESMKIFREIILGVREDFAKAVVELSSKSNASKRYQYEDEMNRNPRFQKLLNECYPEGRDNFDIEFKLDRSSDMNYTFVVKPHFPLNLILTKQSVEGYLFVSRQLHRIRKSLWKLTSLNMKELKIIEDVEPNRALLFRFALIHFCSNIRAYLVFKIFAKDLSVSSTTCSYDLDAIRRVHEEHLQEIEAKLLRSPVMENVIIRKMVSMSDALCQSWVRGIPNKSMVLLEDTLKKCWNVVKTFHRSNYSTDFTELSYHFGPPPSYL